MLYFGFAFYRPNRIHTDQDVRTQKALQDQKIVLLQLPFAKDATWDSSQACMPGTRTALLENFWSWFYTDSDKTSISVLTAPPGAGKTAFAHKVAYDASDSGITILSFFFDRTFDNRNHPRAFVGTIIHLLSGLNPQFMTSLCSTLDTKLELTAASPVRQFNELVVKHAATFTNQHILLIIDALDECSEHSDDLMAILRDQLPALPPSFRVLVTSRSEKPLLRRMQSIQHVHHLTVELDGAENRADISTYVRKRFHVIAFEHGLKNSWPGEERFQSFVEKAGGLFAWASVALDYIGRAKLFGRDEKLKDILSQRCTLITPVQERMDELYITVLGACEWGDVDFVQGYQLVMGSMVALRRPLSKSSLESLLNNTTGVVVEVLDTLSPLFTEWKTDDTPIQLLHLTLHEFLIQQDRSHAYFIDDVKHSRRLGLRCLDILTNTFEGGLPGLGYASSWDPHIVRPLPSIPILGSVAYACRYWIEHISLVQSPIEQEYVDALEMLSPYVISWMELTSLSGAFPVLTELREKIMVCVLLSNTNSIPNANVDCMYRFLAWKTQNLRKVSPPPRLQILCPNSPTVSQMLVDERIP